MRNPPTICNISVKHLRKRQIQNFIEWASMPNSLYIGRDVQFYVPGTVASKWRNPYSVKKYGLKTALKMYRDHVINSDLYNCLEELENKELGCWCKPNQCHGDILIELYKEKII